MRSFIFTNKLTVNRLVALCAPLLLIATELPHQMASSNVKNLYKTCCTHLRTIENKAQKLGYPSDIILAVRFYLSALIDELILNTAWGKNSEWETVNLINTFQRETHRSDRFFEILAHEKKDPEKNIDVIELAYICLRLGFQGKYRQSGNLFELKKISDETYHLIEKIRGEFSKKILLSRQLQKSKMKKPIKFLPIWLTLLLTIAILFGIFFPYYLRLQKVSAPVNQLISNMGQSNAE